MFGSENLLWLICHFNVHVICPTQGMLIIRRMAIIRIYQHHLSYQNRWEKSIREMNLCLLVFKHAYNVGQQDTGVKFLTENHLFERFLESIIISNMESTLKGTNSFLEGELCVFKSRHHYDKGGKHITEPILGNLKNIWWSLMRRISAKLANLAQKTWHVVFLHFCVR